MTNTTVLHRNANVVNLNSSIVEETIFSADGDEADFVMDISRENSAAILNELTDLSANKGAYAIREAYSNAYDATLAAGDMSRPIEVAVPTDLDADDGSLTRKLSMALGGTTRYATITDHGIGMSTDDLRRFFTQYGGTKKQGSGLIGSKGLGSKAPLACADFFDVITVKDGVRSVAHLWRGNGNNYAKITSVEQVDEPNGTTVRIPVIDPKIAKEMDECMRDIAEWNLDANLVYNGEQAKCVLTDATADSDDGSYVFLGNIQVGVDEGGKPIRMRMWQTIESFPDRLYRCYDGWSETVDLNLCGVRYRLCKASAYHYERKNRQGAAIIVAGDPGYLNFTPSRDEVKDDDAKERFLDAVASAEYDAEAVIASLIGKSDFQTAHGVMMKKDASVERTAKGVELFFSSKSVGCLPDDDLFTYDGQDMADYFVAGDDGLTKPASETLYKVLVRKPSHGYIRPNASTYKSGLIDRKKPGYTSKDFPNHEIARMMGGATAVPMALAIPCPAQNVTSRSSRSVYNHNGSLARSLLASHGGVAVVITGGEPDWGAVARRDTSIRRLLAVNGDPKDTPATYLVLTNADEPTEQDLMALKLFAASFVGTWDELCDKLRAAAPKRQRTGAAATAKPTARRVGTSCSYVYDLVARHAGGCDFPITSVTDALFGESIESEKKSIDFDADDLSRTVACVGDGDDPASVARIAAALRAAGKLDADRLVFVSRSYASSRNAYALAINDLRHLVANRGLRILADLRIGAAGHLDGIIDSIDGVTLGARKSGYGEACVSGSIDLGALGITGVDDGAMARIVFMGLDRSMRDAINVAALATRAIGTSGSTELDAVLRSQHIDWWSRNIYGYGINCANTISVALPAGELGREKAIKDALAHWVAISNVSGIRNMLSQICGDGDNGRLAKEILAPGLTKMVTGFADEGRAA